VSTLSLDHFIKHVKGLLQKHPDFLDGWEVGDKIMTVDSYFTKIKFGMYDLFAILIHYACYVCLQKRITEIWLTAEIKTSVNTVLEIS
jgi:hypothetical protein